VWPAGARTATQRQQREPRLVNTHTRTGVTPDGPDGGHSAGGVGRVSIQ